MYKQIKKNDAPLAFVLIIRSLHLDKYEQLLNAISILAVTICTPRHSLCNDPKFQQVEIFDGVGRSIKELLIILITGERVFSLKFLSDYSHRPNYYEPNSYLILTHSLIFQFGSHNNYRFSANLRRTILPF